MNPEELPYFKERLKYYREHSIDIEFAIKICSESLKKNMKSEKN